MKKVYILTITSTSPMDGEEHDSVVSVHSTPEKAIAYREMALERSVAHPLVDWKRKMQIKDNQRREYDINEFEVDPSD